MGIYVLESKDKFQKQEKKRSKRDLKSLAPLGPRRDASGSVQKLTLHTAPINRLLTSYECPGAFSLLQ